MADRRTLERLREDLGKLEEMHNQGYIYEHEYRHLKQRLRKKIKEKVQNEGEENRP